MTSVLRAMSIKQEESHKTLKYLSSKLYSVLNCSHEMFLTDQPVPQPQLSHAAGAAKANWR